MGVQVQKNAIEETISELESDSEKVDFETFCKIAAKHMLRRTKRGSVTNSKRPSGSTTRRATDTSPPMSSRKSSGKSTRNLLRMTWKTLLRRWMRTDQVLWTLTSSRK